MKKKTRKLSLNKESVRNLTTLDAARGAGTGSQPSLCVGCTTEHTWYCPTRSACSVCPICA